MCVFCNPYCDICRPKFAQCGSCGGNVAFSEGACPRCGEPISQEDIDRVTDKLGEMIGAVYGWEFPTEQKERVSARDAR